MINDQFRPPRDALRGEPVQKLLYHILQAKQTLLLPDASVFAGDKDFGRIFTKNSRAPTARPALTNAFAPAIIIS